MRYNVALSVILFTSLAACGTADIYNGAGAIQGTTTSTTTGAGSTTGGTGNGTTTGAGTGGTTSPVNGGTSTTTTTGGMQDPNLGMNPNNGMQNPNNGSGNPNNPNSGDPNGLNPDQLPGNAFFNHQQSNNGQDMFVLVLSSRSDFCKQITEGNLPASSVNVRVEVQSPNEITAGSYQASQASEDVLDANCLDTATNAAPASLALSSVRGESASGTVITTLPSGQTGMATFSAQNCDALGSQNNILSTLLGGLSAGKCKQP